MESLVRKYEDTMVDSAANQRIQVVEMRILTIIIIWFVFRFEWIPDDLLTKILWHYVGKLDPMGYIFVSLDAVIIHQRSQESFHWSHLENEKMGRNLKAVKT